MLGLNKIRIYITLSNLMQHPKFKLFTSLFSALFFCFFITGQSFAQTGKISGQVIDANTKSPLASVNVGLVDTRLGDATDTDGQFTISNVPEGS